MDRNQLQLPANGPTNSPLFLIPLWGWIGWLCLSATPGWALQWTPVPSKSSGICSHCGQNLGIDDSGGWIAEETASQPPQSTDENGRGRSKTLTPLLAQAHCLPIAPSPVLGPPAQEPPAEGLPRRLANPLANPLATPFDNPLAHPLPHPLANPLANPLATPFGNPLAHPLAHPLPHPLAHPLAHPLPHPLPHPFRQPASCWSQPQDELSAEQRLLAAGGLTWESLAETVPSSSDRPDRPRQETELSEELVAEIMEIRASFGGSVARILSDDPVQSAAGDRLFAQQLKELWDQESQPANPPVSHDSLETMAAPATQVVPLPSPGLKLGGNGIGIRSLETSEVQALRRAARQMEQVAADLEEAGLFDQADSVREKGSELWKSARVSHPLSQLEDSSTE